MKYGYEGDKMSEDCTIEEITKKVENASTSFEETNTETKRKYLLWCIYAFNQSASRVSTNRGTFRNRISLLCFRPEYGGKIANNFRTNKI